MRHTIFLKILIGFLIINLILIFAVSAIAYQMIKSHYRETIRSYINDMGNTLMINLTPFIGDHGYNNLDQYVKDIGRQSDFRITIIIPDGTVIADSEADIAEMDDHGERPEIYSAFQGEEGESIRYSPSLQTDMLYKAFPVIIDNEIVAVLRVSLFMADVDTLIESLRTELFRISIFVFLFAIIVIFLLSYHLTLPIKELSKAAFKVSKGDFDVEVTPKTNDDIGNLCRNFNYMVSKIKELISETVKGKESLDRIINTMQEGLLVLDPDGRIDMFNRSFTEIAGADDLPGRLYWEIIRKPELSEFIREMYKTEDPLTKEIEIDADQYICSSLALPDNNRRLIVLYNISGIKDLERVKKDIVANVSHELRSPLTAVKGFIEVLEDEVTPEGENYLEIIKRNIDRLVNIVNDLLTLSKLDRQELSDFNPVHVNDIIDHICRIYKEKIEQKGLKLEIEKSAGLPEINGDEFRLEQLLVNLLENALQYTDEGFIRISSSIGKDNVVLKVTDSGAGISPEHQERIFERFYVVNKSRSRKYGGTGLGLAIVKHITLLHNGTIDIDSEPGKGSSFIIKIPIGR